MEKTGNSPQKQSSHWGKRVEKDRVTIRCREGFALAETLECGQSFRWERTSRGYQGIAFGKRAQLEIAGDEIIFWGVSGQEFDQIWYDYFDFGTDYEDIRRKLCQTHHGLCEMAAFAPGIRILRQDSWEALCTFLLSQNNNIPRIKGIVARLCEGYGEPIAGGYTFPSAQRVAQLDEPALRAIGSGFRAKYLLAAARMVADGQINWEQLRTEEIGKARERLQTIPGVGPKVAECVLLYGLHRLEAFPMDVWMKRAMQQFFPAYDAQGFGEYGGIAQQYIYHYSRAHKDRLTQAGETL